MTVRAALNRTNSACLLNCFERKVAKVVDYSYFVLWSIKTIIILGSGCKLRIRFINRQQIYVGRLETEVSFQM